MSNTYTVVVPIIAYVEVEVESDEKLTDAEAIELAEGEIDTDNIVDWASVATLDELKQYIADGDFDPAEVTDRDEESEDDEDDDEEDNEE